MSKHTHIHMQWIRLMLNQERANVLLSTHKHAHQNGCVQTDTRTYVQIESNVSKSDKLKDVWRRHGLSGERAPHWKIDQDFEDNRCMHVYVCVCMCRPAP